MVAAVADDLRTALPTICAEFVTSVRRGFVIAALSADDSAPSSAGVVGALSVVVDLSFGDGSCVAAERAANCSAAVLAAACFPLVSATRVAVGSVVGASSLVCASMGANASQTSPCGKAGCAAAEGLLLLAPSSSSPDGGPNIGVIVGSVLGSLLLLLLLLLLVRRVRGASYKRGRRGTYQDAGKYTRQFGVPDGVDADVTRVSKMMLSDEDSPAFEMDMLMNRIRKKSQAPVRAMSAFFGFGGGRADSVFVPTVAAPPTPQRESHGVETEATSPAVALLSAEWQPRDEDPDQQLQAHPARSAVRADSLFVPGAVNRDGIAFDEV